jgi:hypothetical protein
MASHNRDRILIYSLIAADISLSIDCSAYSILMIALEDMRYLSPCAIRQDGGSRIQMADANSDYLLMLAKD